MICYAGCDAGCKMQDMTGNAWTWPQLGNPSAPLEIWDEIAWKRYKERQNRSYGLEMASDSNVTPVCDLQQVAILMQWDEQATAFKHANKIHGRDAFKMLNKSLALSYGQIMHSQVQTSMAKVQKISASQTWWKYWTWHKQHQVALFRASKQHATWTYHSKTRLCMNLIHS